MIELRPMSEAEFAAFKVFLYEDYAQDRAHGLGTPIEEERKNATQQIDQLTEEGLASSAHYYWNLVTEDGSAVGDLWVFVEHDKPRAFIYFIGVDEGQRGKGYGQQALAALEDALRPLSVRRIELNVFGDNATAQRLYARAGYEISAMYMRKEI
jgi:RimJ/RimL family protein N-acetyltransferase